MFQGFKRLTSRQREVISDQSKPHHPMVILTQLFFSTRSLNGNMLHSSLCGHGQVRRWYVERAILVVFYIQFDEEKNENTIPSTWMVRWQDSGWGEPQASATDSSCTEVSIATTVPSELLRSKIALPFKLPPHCSLV